jgi:hypothetical protein
MTDRAIAERTAAEVECDALEVELLFVEWFNVISMRWRCGACCSAACDWHRRQLSEWDAVGQAGRCWMPCAGLRAQGRNLYGAESCPRL